MYIVFPDSAYDGLTLLHLRWLLLEWSKQTGIPHELYYHSGHTMMTLPQELDYTLFAIQWVDGGTLTKYHRAYKTVQNLYIVYQKNCKKNLSTTEYNS